MGETLADAIRARLAETGESQQTVADSLGVAQPTFNRWATGLSVPSEKHVAGLARWLRRRRGDVAELAAAGRDAVVLRAKQDERQRRAQAEVPELLRTLVADVAAIKHHLGIE